MNALKIPRALVLLSLLAVPAARADYLTTSIDTNTPIITLNIPSAGVNGESGYVGPNRISYDGSAPVEAYCTDLFRSIGVNDHYAASIAPLSSLSNGTLVARLFSADAARHDGSAMEKAALQLAIWDVVETGRAGLGGYTDPFAFAANRIDRGSDHLNVYGDDAKTVLLFGLSSSSLTMDGPDGSGVLNRMDDLLLSAAQMSGPGASLTYIAPGSYGQGFVYAQRIPNFQSVPEPSSLILSFIGLAGFLGVHLRRRLSGKPTTPSTPR
ncbi:MAG: hypothetical protein JWN86_4728 [Planctomycetota bacterium]|nr:hypothetical protein [Planctomycetota bacterium]